jgi:hypothetical protein
VHRAIVLVALLSGTAAAEDPVPPPRPATQVQLDLGLAVIGAGIEHAVSDQLAVQAEAFITSTYFLDWFGLGPRTDGFGGGVRLTWLEHPRGRGLYGVALLRLSGVHTDASDAFLMTEVGLAAGYAFPVSAKLELRLGLGIVGFHGSGAESRTGMTGTANVGAPFVQLDGVLAYRL